VRLGAGDVMVGLYHTHPGDRKLAGHFSDSDIYMSRFVKLPLFVVAVEARWVISYNPETRRQAGERL
jgi:proteasome lid subunit RPN8/RPN11